MPQKLFAAIPFGKYNDFIVDDEATIVMEYDNGKTGTFILSTGEACHEERLEIIGTRQEFFWKTTRSPLQDTEMYVSISRMKKSTQGRI